MKILNKLLIMLMLLITIGVMIFDFDVSRIFVYFLLVPSFLFPWGCRKLKLKLNELDVMLYYLFILIVLVLGHICDLYNIIWWFDILAHFIFGIYSFYVGVIVLKNFSIIKWDNILFYLFFCICFSAFSAVLWEMVEFTIDYLFNLNIQHSLDTGVVDTMQDIIFAMIGSAINSILYYFKGKKYNY